MTTNTNTTIKIESHDLKGIDNFEINLPSGYTIKVEEDGLLISDGDNAYIRVSYALEGDGFIKLSQWVGGGA